MYPHSCGCFRARTLVSGLLPVLPLSLPLLQWLALLTKPLCTSCLLYLYLAGLTITGSLVKGYVHVGGGSNREAHREVLSKRNRENARERERVGGTPVKQARAQKQLLRNSSWSFFENPFKITYVKGHFRVKKNSKKIWNQKFQDMKYIKV